MLRNIRPEDMEVVITVIFALCSFVVAITYFEAKEIDVSHYEKQIKIIDERIETIKELLTMDEKFIWDEIIRLRKNMEELAKSISDITTEVKLIKFKVALISSIFSTVGSGAMMLAMKFVFKA